MSKRDKLNTFLGLVGKFGPMILPSIPGGQKVIPFIPVITHGIVEAEQLPGASSSEKKAHVLNLLADSVAALNATGKTHLSIDELSAVASQGIDTTIGAVNFLHHAGATVPEGVLLPPAGPTHPVSGSTGD